MCPVLMLCTHCHPYHLSSLSVSSLGTNRLKQGNPSAGHRHQTLQYHCFVSPHNGRNTYSSGSSDSCFILTARTRSYESDKPNINSRIPTNILKYFALDGAVTWHSLALHHSV
eukprot:1150208_1